jgi:hypothetical protein
MAIGAWRTDIAEAKKRPRVLLIGKTTAFTHDEEDKFVDLVIGYWCTNENAFFPADLPQFQARYTIEPKYWAEISEPPRDVNIRLSDRQQTC